MSVAIPVARSDASDASAIKQWAAEDFAISIGLLRECPYHGQPFKVRRNGPMRKALAAGLIDPLDPIVRVFNGDAGELLAAVERVTGSYMDHCATCEASDQEAFD